MIGIKKAPKVLLRNLGLIPEDYSKEKSKPITKTNTGLFGIMDDVFSEVYSQTQKTQPIPIIKEESEKQQDVEEEVIIPLSEEEIKKEVEKEVEKEASLKSAEIKSVSLDLIEKEDIIESKEQLNEESNIQAEEQSLEEDKSEVSKEFDNVNEKVEEKTLETEEAITFEMPEEFALVDLAIALCDDANGWLDIYEVNKSLFDKIILENNNGNNKDIEYNKELFSGLTINVPTVFKKGQENKQSLGKAA
ncbi:MAG: hypothetical protein PHF21_03755 [Bacilli bacterium]|nr:hypothetical protein [Bacilli bacterium]